MPTVEKTSPGRVYVRSVDQEFALGDRADVSEDGAAYLCDERGDFERVDGPDADDGTEATRFDQGQWLNRDYQDREQAVLDGEVDEHLGKILHVETSETVKDAVDERRED